MTSSEHWIVGLYYFCFLLLLTYAVHRLHLVRLRRRLRNRPALEEVISRWPHIAVQLPVYNEPNVVGRLIDTAAALEYPGVLEIQVLDDSTDSTSEIAAQRVAAFRAMGLQIHHIRRGTREGYKAGALAEGMHRTEAELFAIFDADFLPAPQVLIEMVRPFQDERIGMVQARWGHLNREDSPLTRVQGLYLDAHFAVESAARYLDGCFFNFNGTAGVWRRQAIADAGGWSSSTLTEDLDLSYRAQLAGWKFVFLPDVEVPGELPATISAFQGQQHRWAKGSIQTGRKLLTAVLFANAAFRVKAEAFFHLTGNFAYLLSLFIAMLLVPALEIRYRFRWTSFAVIDLLLFVVSAWSLVAFCREGQRQVGRKAAWRDIACLLPLGIGFSVSNAQAVLEGLFFKGGEFRRTAKRGAGCTIREKPPRLPISELILGVFFATSAVIFLLTGRLVSLAFLMIFLSGYLYVVTLSAVEWTRFLARHV